MSFMKELENTLGEEFNENVTENGAVGYRTTTSELLDFNFKISSYRNKEEREIIKDFQRVYVEDELIALKFLFFIRDREEGLGERRLFRVIIKYLAETYPDLIRKIIEIIPEYGRWDDLLVLLDTKLKDDVLIIIKNQLFCDDLGADNNESISLLAKWLPSINASNIERKHQAKIIIESLNTTSAKYRKLLSKLREYIDITERKLCANQWDKIKYEAVPSRANLIYNNAFLRHDEERRIEFLSQVSKGKKKINASKLYPHDIVHKYTEGSWRIRSSIDETLEQLWKSLPKKQISNTLVVSDGSGSMTSRIGNTKISALDVANALAIYFAENNKGEFKNKYITFSENPKFVNFRENDSLLDKIFNALSHCEVANTNIEKVFDLILTTATKNRISQEEMPKNVLIISDMEFDRCVKAGDSWNHKRPNKKMFQVFQERFEEYGYKLPKLIFWNVCSRTETIPIKENDLGVALVSGFSTNIAEMVMSDKLDPLEILLDKLNTPRYNKISENL